MQDVVAADVGLALVADDVVAVGRLGQGREIGDLRQAELVERTVEIVERRLGDAVVARAEIDLVEIELEDALLGVGLLDAKGQDGLADLAGERGLVVQEEVLGDLLGDARGAFRPLAGIGDVGEHGAQDADEIDAGMGEEALVLGRHEGLGHALGHGGDRHEHPLLAGILGQQASVGRVEARHGERLVVGQLLVVGQAVAEVPEQGRDGGQGYDAEGREEGGGDLEYIEHGHLLRKATVGGNAGAAASLHRIGEIYAFFWADDLGVAGAFPGGSAGSGGRPK